MKVCCIQEKEKNKIFEYFFSSIKDIDNVWQISNVMESKNNKTAKRIVSEIKRKMYNEEVSAFVISKELKRKLDFMIELDINKISYFDGRWLFPYITVELIDYITDRLNKQKSELECAILLNEVNDAILKDIKRMAKEFRTLTIVTNYIEKFRKIEEEIYKEYGIVISVNNNKKNSLRKAHIILNVDFVQEVLNKYYIYENAIVINQEGNIKIKKKRFNGIIINDYEISLNVEKKKKYVNKLEHFSLKELFEAEIYRKDFYESIRESIEKSGLEIKELIGNNGWVKIK